MAGPPSGEVSTFAGDAMFRGDLERDTTSDNDILVEQVEADPLFFYELKETVSSLGLEENSGP